MRRRKIRTVVAFSAATLALAALAGLRILATSGGTTLEDCALWGESAEGRSCMADVIAAEIAAHGILHADTLLASFLDQHPEYDQQCHAAGHAAGESSYNDFGRLREALETMEHEVCMSALLHGVIDGWVTTPGARDEWEEAVRICEEAADRWPYGHEEHPVLGRCADGLGHAAYDLTGTPHLCGAFTTRQGQRECGGGVVMQAYLPARGPEGHEMPSYEELVAICLRGPEDVVAVEGCHLGLGHGLQDLMTEAVRPNEGSPAVYASMSLPERLVHAYTTIATLCSVLDETGQEMCEEGVVARLPAIGDDRALEHLCDHVRPTHRPRCLGEPGAPDSGYDTPRIAAAEDER